MSSLKIPPELVTPIINAGVSVITTWLKTRRRTRMIDEGEIRSLFLQQLEESGVVLPPDVVVAKALGEEPDTPDDEDEDEDEDGGA